MISTMSEKIPIVIQTGKNGEKSIKGYIFPIEKFHKYAPKITIETNKIANNTSKIPIEKKNRKIPVLKMRNPRK